MSDQIGIEMSRELIAENQSPTANSAGSGQRRKFTPEECIKIREWNSRGLNDGDIARKLGRPRVSVRKRRVKLGLPPREKHTQWTRKRIARGVQRAIRRDCKRSGFGNYLGISSASRAAQLGWPAYISGRGMNASCWLQRASILYVMARGARAFPEIRDAVVGLRRCRGWQPYEHCRQYYIQALRELVRIKLIRRVGDHQHHNDPIETWEWELTEKAVREHAQRGRPNSTVSRELEECRRNTGMSLSCGVYEIEGGETDDYLSQIDLD